MRRFLLCIGLESSLMLAIGGCSADQTCDPDGIARTLAGPGAKDCGRVSVGGDSKSVDACVAMSFSAHQAFHARFDQQGIDSKVARLIAGNSSGRVFFLHWDSDPSGGGGVHETVDQWECTSPVVNSATTRLDCTSSGPTARVCR